MRVGELHVIDYVALTGLQLKATTLNTSEIITDLALGHSVILVE
jgi:hypothetical protein